MYDFRWSALVSGFTSISLSRVDNSCPEIRWPNLSASILVQVLEPMAQSPDASTSE